MKTEGGSKRKLSERKDPGASVSCYIEQGFPADAMQISRPANGRLAEMPLDKALASASIRSYGGRDTRAEAGWIRSVPGV